jgi:hypothetical protein
MLLEPTGCGYHYGRALDVFGDKGPGNISVGSVVETLAPLNLYRAAHGEPPFMKSSGGS